MSDSLNKVAAVTFSFWVLKICATTLGETGGDLLSMTLKVGYAESSLILIGIFLAVLFVQLRATKFHPLLYWSVILLTSTAGTTMSDFMDRSLGLGYAKGSALLITLLLAALLAWRLTEGTLSVSTIKTRRAELFYWTAILCSNTLGTAFGDYLSDASGLGFARCAALIAGAIALCALLYATTKISRVALFWVAFVLTRPFGAEFGDVLTKTHAQGGLQLGTIGSSAVLMGIFILGLILTHPRDRTNATT